MMIFGNPPLPSYHLQLLESNLHSIFLTMKHYFYLGGYDLLFRMFSSDPLFDWIPCGRSLSVEDRALFDAFSTIGDQTYLQYQIAFEELFKGNDEPLTSLVKSHFHYVVLFGAYFRSQLVSRNGDHEAMIFYTFLDQKCIPYNITSDQFPFINWLSKSQITIYPLPSLSACKYEQKLLAQLIYHCGVWAISTKSFWKTLVLSPIDLRSCLFPTTPTSEIAMISYIMPELGWYTCPNGHPYSVGECTKPMQLSYCHCGAMIGGRDHIPHAGNSSYIADDRNLTGLPLEFADQSCDRLSPTTTYILRIFLFSSLLISQSIGNVRGAEEIIKYDLHQLLSSINLLLNRLSSLLNISFSSVISILHVILSTPFDISRSSSPPSPLETTLKPSSNHSSSPTSSPTATPSTSFSKRSKTNRAPPPSTNSNSVRVNFGVFFTNSMNHLSSFQHGDDLFNDASLSLNNLLIWRLRISSSFSLFTTKFELLNREVRAKQFAFLSKFIHRRTKTSTYQIHRRSSSSGTPSSSAILPSLLPLPPRRRKHHKRRRHQHASCRSTTRRETHRFPILQGVQSMFPPRGEHLRMRSESLPSPSSHAKSISRARRHSLISKMSPLHPFGILHAHSSDGKKAIHVDSAPFSY
jgi:hypothetical protein